MNSIRLPAFAVFSILFISSYTSIIANIVVNLSAIYLLFWCIANINYVKFSSILGLNIVVPVFAFIVIISALYNYYDTLFPTREDIVNPLSAFRFALSTVSIFYTLQIICRKKKIYSFLNKFFKILVFFIVVVDIYALLNRPSTGEGEEAQIVYLICGKFTLVYMHLFAFSLLWFISRINKRIPRLRTSLYFLWFLSFFFSIYLFCTTALLGSLVFLALYILSDKVSKLVVNNYVLLGVLIASTLFVIFVTTILQNERIIYFIEEVLHEDSTLTGRTMIYAQIFDIISHRPWIGYGFGNSHSVISYFIDGNVNSQNGILENIINCGLIGLSFFLGIIVICTKQCHKYVNFVYPFFCMLFTLVFMSSVEITLGLLFLFTLLLPTIMTYGIRKRSLQKIIAKHDIH